MTTRRRMIGAGLAAGFARAGLSALPVSLLAGCFAGAGDAAHTWWDLEAPEAGGSAIPDPVRARKSLVVEGLAAGVLYDGATLLFSRAPGVRAPYQYASWTERPAARIARLTMRRLRSRGGFRDVSTAEAGVAPDLLLTLTVERLYHDLTVEPGLLRLQVAATLTDWHRRRPIAGRQFEVDEPVGTADAAGAAAAAGRAVGRLLDELAPWVEASAIAQDGEGRPAAGRRPPEPVPYDGSSRDSFGAGSIDAGTTGREPGLREPGVGAGEGLPPAQTPDGTGLTGSGPAATERRRFGSKTRPPGYEANRNDRSTGR